MILFKTLVRKILISDVIGNLIRFVTSTVRANDLKFSISSRHIRGKIISLIFFKKYEKEEVQMIRKYMRNDLPIIDLGSSLGIVATNAAKVSNQSIICVEANVHLTDVICENLANNGIDENRFLVINAAICDLEQANKPIYFSSRGSNELGKICEKESKNAVRVETLLLSDLVEQKDNYILISDIEGAEAAFLFSDSDCLDSCQQLFIELHAIQWKGVQYEVQDLTERIESLGFTEVEKRGMNYYYTRYEKS